MLLLLIVLMLVMAVNSITLKNSSEGLRFYLVPDFDRMLEQGIGNVVFAAMTHAFFTLSVGMGSMEIFGSYLTKERKLTDEAVNVVALDTMIVLAAGIIIIPACFAYGIQRDAGPSLLFITLPNVFSHMPGGLLFVLFCVKKNGWGFDNFTAEANTGTGKDFPKWLRGYMTYVLPLFVLVIYFKGYYDMFRDRGTAELCLWMGLAVVFAGFVVCLTLYKGKNTRLNMDSV